MIEGRSVWGFNDGMLEMEKAECFENYEIGENIWKIIVANAY